MSKTMQGLELARRYYFEAVAPLIADRWPELGYSAALIGQGSEVLGFDDEVSRDHHWGPRVMVFLDKRDKSAIEGRPRLYLSEHLPVSFCGFSTNFGPPDPEDIAV